MMARSTQLQHTLLITGIPGVGKTTLIRRVAKALSDRTIAGFYTGEICEAGERQGFRLVTFSGEEVVIAHVDFSHRYAVGKYGVDVAAIDRFADSVLTLSEGIDLYIVDEIGKMECFSPRFTSAIRVLLEGERPLIATIAKKGIGLIDEVKHRPGCDLWEVTLASRDKLVEDVLGWVLNRL